MSIPASEINGVPKTDGDFVQPPLRGRHVYLRPLMPQDYPLLQQVEMGSDANVRWRFRGATPSPEQWMQATWTGVLAQFVVARRRDDRPIGMVVIYRANFQHRHAYLAAVGFERPSPLMVFACALFIEYVFTIWGFHKLYLELPEFNLSQFASGVGSYFVEEGRLREHSFHGDRMWDEVILALYRDRWREHGPRLLEAERSGKPLISSIRMRGEGELWRR
jgi:RimJ/RimL family protein N-acetyltransferase